MVNDIKMPTGTFSYIIMNNLGGITSFTQNLLKFRGDTAVLHQLVLLDLKENPSTKLREQLVDGIDQKIVEFSATDNWYHLVKKIRDSLPPGPGLIISNDVYDLQMTASYKLGKKIVQIIHDGYNLKLAVVHAQQVDAFICHSHFFYEVMIQLFPSRRQDIYHIPYGIELFDIPQQQKGDRLQLVFLGRLVKEKGIFDLLAIDQLLIEKGIKADWHIIGNGPGKQQLADQWMGRDNAFFYSPATSREVREICARCNIMVFPTIFEGFPVALLESMSVGCVPVVSDLPGGIREVVTAETGFRVSLNRLDEFATAIEKLAGDHGLLERLSINCVNLVNDRHNAAHQSHKYQQVFQEVFESSGDPIHHKHQMKIGSMLDQKWLPNDLSRGLRHIKKTLLK